MLLDDSSCRRQPRPREAVVRGHGDLRIKPKLGFPGGVLDVHVKPRLLPREEIQTIAPNSKDGWTHTGKVTGVGPVPRRGLTEHVSAAGATGN